MATEGRRIDFMFLRPPFTRPLDPLLGRCHGMTKSVKVHRKDQSVNKNAYLASFVCFFNFPDRNVIILYKIT